MDMNEPSLEVPLGESEFGCDTLPMLNIFGFAASMWTGGSWLIFENGLKGAALAVSAAGASVFAAAPKGLNGLAGS